MPNKSKTKKPGNARAKNTKTKSGAAKPKPAAAKNKAATFVTKKTTSSSERKSLVARLIAALKTLLKNKKRAQSSARSEFRFNFRTSHPNYIFEADEKRKKYSAVGITHEEKTFGRNNMPLKNNPKKGDKKPAYVRNGIIEDGQRSFGRRKIKNMEFSEADLPNVKSKIRKHKSERRKKRKKKEASHTD